jgi:hypothetical protein
MEDTDLTDGDLLSDKMEINLHMLSALMLNGVDGEVHGVDVVAVDKGAPRRRVLELMEQLPQPSGLSHTVGDGTVLSLRAGTGDDSLPFGRSGQQVGPQKHRIARSRATCVRTTRPISVYVDSEVRVGPATQDSGEGCTLTSPEGSA